MSVNPFMVGANILARQLERYGRIMSNALALDPEYSEEQCGECAYGHACCDLLVTVTPYEALGIMSWLRANVPGWREVLERVKLRAESMRDIAVDKEGKPRFETADKFAAAWRERKVKCVFYDNKARDGAGGCSIYPVRPVNCRKAFGRGDCADDDEDANGIKAMAEDPALYENRAHRVRIRQLEAYGQNSGEMCSLITMMRDPAVSPIEALTLPHFHMTLHNHCTSHPQA
ncbi:MAG: YkgJ family cysteine cluster protein [Nitrospinae bacterium]|nr:YkgJ family cysteine cluster protein [Nitrospinota bacterium]